MRLDASLVWQYIYLLVGQFGSAMLENSVVMFRQENKNNLGNSEGF